MRLKFLIYFFLIFTIFQSKAVVDEININSSSIEVLDEGNIINALNVEADIPEKQIEIEGDKSIYDKKKSELTIIDNVKFFDELKNVYLEGKKVIYNQITDIVQTFGETYIKIESKYDVYSQDLIYDRKSQKYLL